MLVFHGSNMIVDEPVSDRNMRDDLDFGFGFYVTTVRDDAEIWANDKAQDYGGEPIINEYNLDESYMDECLLFENTDDEWFDFLDQCRSGQTEYLKAKYPIVEGEVANDRGSDIFKDYHKGEITREEAFEQLTSLNLGWQICLRTDEVIQNYLTPLNKDKDEFDDYGMWY